MVVRAEKTLLEAHGHEVALFEADNREIAGAMASIRAGLSAVWSSASR